MNRYLVCTIKPWHLAQFEKYSTTMSGKWALVSDPKELTYEFVQELKPTIVFFPHWSWRVDKKIIKNFTCVCFHSSDVPFGRGGSPIQNLIIRGYNETKVSALRMVAELDAGPVYMKKPLSLVGNAQTIFEKLSKIVTEMICEIIEKNPQPISQVGEAVVFLRRQPDENFLPSQGTIEHLYNHIRMLDADTYPRSHVFHGDFEIVFSEAILDKNQITARVEIKKKVEL